MKIKSVKREFIKLISNSGIDINTMTPSVGIASVVSFYNVQRIEYCIFENDGDMLLYQWGTYNWGNGEFFELNITRQLIPESSDDDEIWQLGITFKYIPNDQLRALGSGNKWCNNLDNVGDFMAFIESNGAYKFLSNERANEIDIAYEITG